MVLKDLDEALSWLNQLDKFSIKPGLERMEYVLGRLGHPERRLKFIHIAGTNGKGSTSAMMESVLREAGYSTGLFTSPYIESFTSRIRYNGEAIFLHDLLKVMNEIRPIVDELSDKKDIGIPTEFEVVTILAIVYFAKISFPDIVVWETGLGGRLDSTNVVTPIVSVITNVGFDHMNILGATLQEIAGDKAGIIKNGVPVVTGIQNAESLSVIIEEAKKKKATVYAAGKEFFRERKHPQPGVGRETFDFHSLFSSLQQVQVSLLGEHQIANASLALMALQVLKSYYAMYIEEEHIRQGLIKTSWPGRFEKINEKPTIILDGAHNEEGVRALAKTLDDFYPDTKINLLFAVLHDKPYGKMVDILAPYGKHVTVTAVAHPRKAVPEEVAKHFIQVRPTLDVQVIADWREAFNQCTASLTEDGILLVVGSLYFISDIRNEWLNLNRKDGE
ncbi:MAG TPA: bifunctional folylpolyglutamate synthase/dihydrofolate synthase [Paenibacillaceae bacterium]|nr:bifunctional folylpolyglutamate synthase/dihydrofolate synthase [Paenibacillaceae bacterium]